MRNGDSRKHAETLECGLLVSCFGPIDAHVQFYGHRCACLDPLVCAELFPKYAHGALFGNRKSAKQYGRALFGIGQFKGPHVKVGLMLAVRTRTSQWFHDSNMIAAADAVAIGEWQ